jgi:hypothetical protein
MNGLGGKARHEVGTTSAFASRSARRIRSYDEKAPENWCNFGPTAEVGLVPLSERWAEDPFGRSPGNTARAPNRPDPDGEVNTRGRGEPDAPGSTA